MLDIMGGGFARLSLLVCMVVLAGCNAKGLLDPAEPFQVTKVQVTMADGKVGTVNLREDVRVKTLREAYRYSETGQPKTLRVRVENLHIKHPLTSVLVGDSNRMTASAEIIDNGSGESQGKVTAVVIDSGHVQGVTGALLAAVDNPVEVEQRLATIMAARLLEEVYGSTYAKQVKGRTASRRVAARYPASYAKLKQDLECEVKLKQQRRVKKAPTGNIADAEEVYVPDYCKA